MRTDPTRFQAPGFYRKLGFEIVDSLPDYPRGHEHLRLRKVLRRLEATRLIHPSQIAD